MLLIVNSDDVFRNSILDIGSITSRGYG